MKFIGFVVSIALLGVAACAQDKSQPGETGIEAFLGVWEAFREGSPPTKEKGEEPSKVVVFRDRQNMTIVFLAHRITVSPGKNAERQINFAYGKASLDKGTLRFRDQHGLGYVLFFGNDVEHGRVLTVASDMVSELEYGNFLRVALQ